jgi:hypothetical protein
MQWDILPLNGWASTAREASRKGRRQYEQIKGLQADKRFFHPAFRIDLRK